MMSRKAANFNQNPQTPTQKMPMAFFATGNRQLYTLVKNHVNNLIAYISHFFHFFIRFFIFFWWQYAVESLYQKYTVRNRFLHI